MIYNITTRYTRYCCLLLLAAWAALGSGCKKFIQVDVPPTSVNAGNVYLADNTAIAVLTDIYTNMPVRVSNSSLPDDGILGISWMADLSADNLTLVNQTSTKLLYYYQNTLQSTGTYVSGVNFWSRFYEYIYRINAALEGVTGSTSLSPAVKTQLEGECYFLRGFCYFYLVNLYGDVPLILTSDYETNALASRTATATVYKQIIADLAQAKSLLNTQYLELDLKTATTERIRVNSGAAAALLARAYLYTGDYVNAEANATEVIGNSLYTLETSNLNNVFLKNSSETIWALQPTYSTSQNTFEGVVFILPAGGPTTTNPCSLSADLVNAFDATDKRLLNWVGKVTAAGTTYYYPYKYKAGAGSYSATTLTEYEMVLRVSEQYLIRAEARAQQNKLTGDNSAASDLNAIRTRAGLAVTTAATQTDLLNAVLLERRKELFTEWGHRWFDLKRTGKIDAVMQAYAPVKGGSWQSYMALYPIAQTEIALDPGMTGQQNPGYN